MVESFDPFEYVEHLRRNLRVVLVACIVATVIALSVSLLQPKLYTATATIIINPPGTGDLRMSSVVSPMYLESLKTYEIFAASDSLFLMAATKFRLQATGRTQSIEALKKRVLKVSKLRDTKILEISATLSDPTLSQRFAKYLAEQTIALSRNESASADRDIIQGAERQAQEAEKRLDLARQLSTENAIMGESIATLQIENDANVDLLSRLQQSLAEARTDLADFEERALLPISPNDSDGPALAEFNRRRIPTEQARIVDLKQQIQDLKEHLARSSPILSARSVRSEELGLDLKVARAAYEAAVNRVSELRASAGTRGETLRMVDPGIVPERPSSPNIPLNTVVALLLALIASLGYLSLAFAYRQRSSVRSPVSLSRAG